MLRIAAELLAKGEGGCVLRMGAADFDDFFPSLGFLGKRLVEVLQGGQQFMHNLLRAGDVHRSWVGVIGGLAHVDVVIGMNRLFGAHHAAQHLDGAV